MFLINLTNEFMQPDVALVHVDQAIQTEIHTVWAVMGWDDPSL